MAHPLYPSHILRTQDFSKQFINSVLLRTAKIKQQFNRPAGRRRLAATLPGKHLLNWFYEPSTRTLMSFESAIRALGGRYKTVSNASKFSSAYKGENIYDTIETLKGYNYDVIVIRSKEEGIPAKAAEVSKVPIINAGDGSDQHPTQSLLDLFTIFEHFKKVDGLKIVMCGDLKYGRTVHSLTYLLANNFEKMQIKFISPPEVKMKKGVIQYLEAPEIQAKDISFEETDDFESALKWADVFYHTRIQDERFKNIEDYHKVAGKFIINENNIKLMKQNAVLMHPLPIAGPTIEKPHLISEITQIAKLNPHFIAFKQSANGMFVRMTLVEGLLLDPADFKIMNQ